MWKYVSRRVKDTLERTCNVLDVSRTSFCSSPQKSEEAVSSDGRVVLYKRRAGGLSWFRDAGRFSGKDEEQEAGQERQERERLRYQEGLAQSWLSALTWSSAIVCGWYTSQYMCLRRKRMGWTPMDRQCVYSNLLVNTTRSLHTNVTSRIAYAAPPTMSSIGSLLQNVNHPMMNDVDEVDHGPAQKTTTNRKTSSVGSWGFHSNGSSSTSSNSSTLDSAVAEFSFTIGEIEYQFAVQDLVAENYKSAVNHLKLATTHHHPSATFNLGLCYERGLGVPRDLKMAMHCYTVASSMGHAKAMYNLGVLYVQGKGGLKRSRKAARECFDSAARLGQPEAQLALDMKTQRQMKRETHLEPKLMSHSSDSGFGVPAF